MELESAARSFQRFKRCPNRRSVAPGDLSKSVSESSVWGALGTHRDRTKIFARFPPKFVGLNKSLGSDHAHCAR
ncbi:hypothetical protein LINPERPRIM_LOCUS33047, partial [Linum perenne]